MLRIPTTSKAEPTRMIAMIQNSRVAKSIKNRPPGTYSRFQGDRKGHPRGINLTTSPTASVGARAADVGLGGPLWSPASCSSCFHVGGTRPYPPPVDHKGA